MELWNELKINGVDLTHNPLAEYRDVFFFVEEGVRCVTSTQKILAEQELTALGVEGDLSGYLRYQKAFNDRDESRLRHFPSQATYFTDSLGKPMSVIEAEKRLADKPTRWELACAKVIGWNEQPGSEWTEEVSGSHSDALARRDELIKYHGDPDTPGDGTHGTGCGVNVKIYPL